MFKKIFFKFFLTLFMFAVHACKVSTLDNPCDPWNESNRLSWWLKIATNDASPFCGFRNVSLPRLGNSDSSGTSSTNPDGSNSGATGSTVSTAPTPTFSISPGTYSVPQSVSLLVSDSQAQIHFTLDGTIPTSNSPQFQSPIPLWQIAGRTVRAIARVSGKADSPEISGVFSFSVMRTRQTSTFTTGDDGALQKGVAPSYGNPTPHPTFTSDYTTTDNATSLVWKTCSQGQTGATCIGGATGFTNSGASASCLSLNSLNSGSGYAGRTNWRLPTMKELTSLTNFQLASLTIDTTAFPGTQQGFAYWASNSYSPNNTFNWYVDYTSGYSFSNNSPDYYARCVSAPALQEITSLTNLGNGIIRDNVTGLHWQKCIGGQNNDAGCSGTALDADWATAVNYCNALTLGGRTWRLPNINELYTIFDYSVGGANSPRLFPDFRTNYDTSIGYYWTSTSYIPNVPSARAWAVYFGDSTDFNSLGFDRAKSTLSRVRCVSD